MGRSSTEAGEIGNIGSEEVAGKAFRMACRRTRHLKTKGFRNFRRTYGQWSLRDAIWLPFLGDYRTFLTSSAGPVRACNSPRYSPEHLNGAEVKDVFRDAGLTSPSHCAMFVMGAGSSPGRISNSYS